MQQSKPIRSVILVGCGNGALGVIRSLSRRGVPCWMCHDVKGLEGHSRYVRFRRTPSPIQDERGAIDALIALARSLDHRPVLMVSAVERWAQVVGRYKVELEKHMSVCAADGDVINFVIDKKRFHEWATSRSLSNPRTLPARLFDPAKLGGYPVAAKSCDVDPETGYEGDNRRDNRFIPIRNDAQWDAFRRAHADDLDLRLVQEMVPGPIECMYSVGYYADADSEIRALFVGSKIRGVPLGYGNATAGQNDVVPETVVEECRLIVKELGLTGIGEVEYKKDERSGAFRLIEVNARPWGWVGISAGSSADVPWIAYQDMIGWDPAPAVCNARPGSRKYVRLAFDLLLVFASYPLKRRDLMMSPRAWWRSLDADDLVVAEWQARDWPLIGVSTLKLVFEIIAYPFRRVAGRFGARADEVAAAR